MKCQSCGEEEIGPDGIITFVGQYCENCHDRMEKGKIEAEESVRSMDFDYSVNG